MINHEKLSAVIAAYKEYFPEHWQDEMYKWEAIQHFQKHWDINAENFLDMFVVATDKTFNLLANMNNYPRSMIKAFATADAEAVRGMFINLYDESKNLAERIEQFQVSSDEMRLKYDDGTWRQHYQGENAITTYLWLRYPDKYYIYKYSEIRAFAKAIESDFVPKKGGSTFNVEGGLKLYNEVREIITQDAEMDQLLKGALKDSCYPDPEKTTMTTDVGFFVSRFYGQKAEKEEVTWFPADYSPNLAVEDWKKLLQDKDIFTEGSLQIMKRFLDYGGEATCKQLSVKYGESNNFYNSGSSYLAKRIHEKTGCPLLDRDNENSRYWTVLYLGHSADKEVDGSYVWKLRDELREALSQTDLSAVSLYAKPEGSTEGKGGKYWWLNANPKIWSFANLDIGDEQTYTLYNENGNKRRIFQNFLDAKAGDMVIGYESYPVKQIVAIAQIARENDGENLYFKKVEGLAVPIDYLTLKDCSELAHMEYFVNPQGSLFKLTRGEFDFIMDIIRENNGSRSQKDAPDPYTKEEFLKEVYMTEERYDTLVALLKNKKNLILQGAPGVGKTFAAKRLAYSMMGEMDESRIEFIQFHQNYSYEDFIMGYKPQEEGFKLTNGIFHQFCMNAANHPDKDYFFIIDEINRGNMSKIFGELLMLIEKDYRGTKATLAYSGTPFSVPKNLYIIGMMNTADRSLAMIDYALRRRFSFFEMEPGFNSDGFKAYQESLQNETFNALIEQVIDLNREIKIDDSLGEGFRIGHSYFCGQESCTEEWMKSVVYYDIIPMLQEYWFDDKQKVQRWENNLSGVFND
ncbi:MAG: EVE domain-containing protein [Lachnospiraceae bacterium]|nr:EVE domain-containing protein [Lachnospiraceae bacterium]